MSFRLGIAEQIIQKITLSDCDYVTRGCPLRSGTLSKLSVINMGHFAESISATQKKRKHTKKCRGTRTDLEYQCGWISAGYFSLLDLQECFKRNLTLQNY